MGSNMSSLVAIGGGEITHADTEPIDTHVRDLAGGETAAALFVPTASNDAPGYCDAFDSYYGDRLGCETRHLTISDGTPDSARIRSQLDWADLVYVGGGSLPRLLEVWRETEFDRMLYQSWQNGTTVAGLSAGAMCWFASGLTDAAEGEEYIAVECLDWVPDLACTAHATRARRRAFQASLGRGQAGLALEDGAAVELDDGGYRIHSATGVESVYHYRYGETGIEVSELPQRESFTDIATLR
jgi:dipeptidase E